MFRLPLWSLPFPSKTVIKSWSSRNRAIYQYFLFINFFFHLCALTLVDDYSCAWWSTVNVHFIQRAFLEYYVYILQVSERSVHWAIYPTETLTPVDFYNNWVLFTVVWKVDKGVSFGTIYSNLYMLWGSLGAPQTTLSLSNERGSEIIVRINSIFCWTWSTA